MKTISIIDIMKPILIGKKLKICVKATPITETHTVVKKKKTATLKQFESGNERFRETITTTGTVGFDREYQNIKIVDVSIAHNYNDYWDISSNLLLKLEDGSEVDLEVDYVLNEIEPNVYDFSTNN